MLTASKELGIVKIKRPFKLFEPSNEEEKKENVKSFTYSKKMKQKKIKEGLIPKKRL